MCLWKEELSRFHHTAVAFKILLKKDDYGYHSIFESSHFSFYLPEGYERLVGKLGERVKKAKSSPGFHALSSLQECKELLNQMHGESSDWALTDEALDNKDKLVIVIVQLEENIALEIDPDAVLLSQVRGDAMTILAEWNE